MTQAVNGNRLRGLCKSNVDTASTYIAGAVDAMIMARAGILMHQHNVSDAKTIADYVWNACIVEGVTPRQLKDIACTYLDKNAATRHQSSPVLIMRALNEAFPCKK